MAIIKFNLENFEPVPEGERVLKIKEAKCEPSGKPTKMEVIFEDRDTKRTLKSTYSFSSEGAMKALGFLCRVALDLPDMDEFDTVADTPKLVGKTLLCIIKHTEGTQEREDGTLPVFANIERILELMDVADAYKTEIRTASSPRTAIPTGDLD